MIITPGDPDSLERRPEPGVMRSGVQRPPSKLDGGRQRYWPRRHEGIATHSPSLSWCQRLMARYTRSEYQAIGLGRWTNLESATDGETTMFVRKLRDRVMLNEVTRAARRASLATPQVWVPPCLPRDAVVPRVEVSEPARRGAPLRGVSGGQRADRTA